MQVTDILEKLNIKARKDENFRKMLLATKDSADPIGSFCSIARENSYELYDMDIIDAGESFHAAMKRSTNGGGENSPMLAGQDDFYEMFISSINDMG